MGGGWGVKDGIGSGVTDGSGLGVGSGVGPAVLAWVGWSVSNSGTMSAVPWMSNLATWVPPE